MPHLICYDITKDSLRTKVGKKIIEYGLDRINKSVYLGTLKESSLTLLVQLLSNLVVQKGDPSDSIIVIYVSGQSVQDMIVLGKNDLDKDQLSGDKHTLIV
jgi:CRISPR-associated protein Cas2